MQKYKVENLNDLSIKLKVPYKTLRNWKYENKKYLPSNLVEEFSKDLEILDIQPDNWGQKKGGSLGIEKKVNHLRKLWNDPNFLELRKKSGKTNIFILNKKIKDDKEFKSMIIKKSNKSKTRKRQTKSELLELCNRSYFTNEEIVFDNSKVNFSKYDHLKKVKLPIKMTPKLAEEIGIHLGDGCLSLSRRYFSVKTNKKESEYMVNFLFPLYKELYNLDLKLMELKSVVGFEVHSQALFEFKNKVLNIPFGNKVNKITVPPTIIKSKNKEIYSSFIRGLFDTDGCVNIIKSKNNYPTISFTIKSELLIKKVGEMLEQMGFIPYIGKYIITLNGELMVEKWIKEIGSSNSKNIIRLKQASSSTRIE